VALLDWHPEQHPAFMRGNLERQPVHAVTLCYQFPIGTLYLLQGGMEVGQVHTLKVLHKKIATAKVKKVPRHDCNSDPAI
jgi:transketolase C-terminal domain/subunit